MLGGSTTAITEIKSARAVSTTPATAVRLASEKCSGVIIQALPTNTNNISVGGPETSAAVGSEKGTMYKPVSAFSPPLIIYCNNADRIWFDVITSGEGVMYSIIK